ncbi:fumarylacetoacetate hydrolase family protein [Streptomyces sp. NPDC004610]|uniref:fumarylacetoacetate hydrolase family protein n=1 Tax=unclassified Streptomyces TaxID=2593676 RepID=UPI0033AA556A
MRIARFTTTPGGPPRYGEITGSTVRPLDGDPYAPGAAPPARTGERLPLDAVRLLAPVPPTAKIIGVGRNYAAHAAELGNAVPAPPLLFFKPYTAVTGPGAPIEVPAFSADLHHEAELAVVIGARAKHVRARDARGVVLGCTAANDVTARDVQRADVQFTRSKGFDTSCPLGPWIDTALAPDDLRVRCRVDGVTRQDGRTGQMVLGVDALIEHISAAFTLLPGDVILTGTPAGVGPLRPGQTVEVDIEGLGVLSNPVVAGGG